MDQRNHCKQKCKYRSNPTIVNQSLISNRSCQVTLSQAVISLTYFLLIQLSTKYNWKKCAIIARFEYQIWRISNKYQNCCHPYKNELWYKVPKATIVSFNTIEEWFTWFTATVEYQLSNKALWDRREILFFLFQMR